MADTAAQGAGVYTLTLTTSERRVVAREAKRKNPSVAAEDVLARVVTGALGTFRAQQGDRRASRLEVKYGGLSASDKAKVDALMPGVSDEEA